jgi:hypothetical protein
MDMIFLIRGRDWSLRQITPPRATVKPTKGRSDNIKIQRMIIDPNTASLITLGRIDADRVDATTEEEMAHQKADDITAAPSDSSLSTIPSL